MLIDGLIILATSSARTDFVPTSYSNSHWPVDKLKIIKVIDLILEISRKIKSKYFSILTEKPGGRSLYLYSRA